MFFVNHKIIQRITRKVSLHITYYNNTFLIPYHFITTIRNSVLILKTRIEEVRNLLKGIDLSIDSESRIMNDQIDDFKELHKEYKDTKESYSSIHGEIKNLTTEIDELTYEKEQLKKKVSELSPLEKQCEEQNEIINKLQQKQQGFIYTISVISDWIPSQKENMDVLVALSSSYNHESTFSELQEETTIPAVTLKNRIIAILIDSSLVKLDKDNVRLTIKEKKE